MKKYLLTAIGGTFDRLHRGHRDFLDFALSLGDYVLLGLTSDLYIEQYKNGKGIEPYEVRLKNLENYLESINERDYVEIIPIDDIFGPTVSSKFPIDALVVTEDTKKGGEEINRRREENGLAQLPLRVFHLTREGHGVPISSSAIRHVIFRLPEALRPLLQEPWGEVIEKVPGNLDPQKLVTVGDVTTKMFLDQRIIPKLAIVDLKIERDHKVRGIQELGFIGNEHIMHVKNSAATITSELEDAIKESLEGRSQFVIVVEGEEDLAVLPVLIHAQLGLQVFYGQPGQGMVQVKITPEIKKKAETLLMKFEKTNS